MYCTTSVIDASPLFCGAYERKSVLAWRGRFERPQRDRIVLFDFGAGAVVGEFNGAHFVSAERPGEWDPVLVNKWRYVDKAN
jgi:hypothetical protein